MDPWAEERNSGDILVNSRTQPLKFEDNFAPTIRESLPDSDQYLAALEERLRKIKNDPNVLKQLAAKREACMQNFLNSEVNFIENSTLDEPVNNSQLLRTILPQRQALNRGEIVELVQYDQLSDSESDH